VRRVGAGQPARDRGGRDGRARRGRRQGRGADRARDHRRLLREDQAGPRRGGRRAVRLGGGGFALGGASLGVSRWRRFLGRFDWPLAAGIALLVAAGLSNLYSATVTTPHSHKFEQQVLW